MDRPEGAEDYPRFGREILLARASGQLLALCAREAWDPWKEEGYWSIAISLLDQMCEVGEPGRGEPRSRADRLAWLERMLGSHMEGVTSRATARAHAPFHFWTVAVPDLSGTSSDKG
jgi:hypothetical protein